MIDRKKVIKGLMVCINRIPGKYSCNECPYEIDGEYCEINMAKDALALLREREAVEPQKEDDGNPKPCTAWWYVCGGCGREIEYRDRFCRWCGREAKWK